MPHAPFDEPVDVAIDATICPLCGSANRCAMEQERITGKEQPPCWCLKVDFSDSVLQSIPDSALGVACLCSACAAKTESASG